MSAGPVILFVAGCLAGRCLEVPEQIPNIREILARVQANTGYFEATLPDFTCDEKITSRRTERWSVISEKIIESHFVGLQRPSDSMAFTEKREIVTVGGKPAAKNEKVGRAFLFEGGFSSVLDETFAPSNVPFHDYWISGTEQFGGRPALVIGFATKPDQKALWSGWNGKKLVDKDTGTAWIDIETTRVLRILRHYLNVGPVLRPAVATVDYSEVIIDGKPYWMPSTVQLQQCNLNGHDCGEYRAEYSNYRKFDVSSSIRFSFPGHR